MLVLPRRVKSLTCRRQNSLQWKVLVASRRVRGALLWLWKQGMCCISVHMLWIIAQTELLTSPARVISETNQMRTSRRRCLWTANALWAEWQAKAERCPGKKPWRQWTEKKNHTTLRRQTNKNNRRKPIFSLSPTSWHGLLSWAPSILHLHLMEEGWRNKLVLW